MLILAIVLIAVGVLGLVAFFASDNARSGWHYHVDGFEIVPFLSVSVSGN